jgi:Holliday junction resolvase-like predicted endonuclease
MAPIIDFHDMDELKNRNEEKVWRAIEEYLATNEKVCRCRDCILDAAALALNGLPARYTVYSFHGNMPEEKDPAQEVSAAVAEAFRKVTARPHH